MRGSCIRHPAKEPLIIVREWQIEACDGNRCAAILLSFFEYWHDIKLQMASKAARQNSIAIAHGDSPTQDETLLQFHNEQELEAGILGFYGASSIRKAIALLKEKDFISVCSNPNSRYKFDQTRYFLFCDEQVNQWLENHCSADSLKVTDRDVKTTDGSFNLANESVKTTDGSFNLRNDLYTETTPEITSKITSEITEREEEAHSQKVLSELELKLTQDPIADESEKGESQNLMLCLEIQEESKVKTGKRRKRENQDTPQVPQPPPSKLSKADCDRFVAAWNEVKPAHFIGMLALTDSKLSKSRKAIFESMVKESQSVDIAIAALQHYLRTSATDSYWSKDGFKPKFENLASNEKLDLAAQSYRISLEATPISALSASPKISDEPRFQPQTINATANYEKRFANPHKYPALIEAGHGDIMVGMGYLDFDPIVIEVAVLHLKKHELACAVGDGKRFISNRIKQADWAAIELLKESAATIAGDRQKTEAAIAASVSSDSEYYDTSRYCIPEPLVIDLEARAKATEGGRAKMRETIAQALKNRAS